MDAYILPPPQNGPAVATYAQQFTWGTGEFWITVDVDALASSVCKVETSVTGDATIVQQTLSVGAHAYHFTNVDPGDTLDLVQLQCSGGSTSDIDWIAISNSSMVFPPMMDMDATASPMKVPWSGDMHFVRTDRDGEYIFAGSSVGGFAWSTDGETWEFGNGMSQDFVEHGDMGVWDFYYDSGASWRGLLATGHQADGSQGGLWSGSWEGNGWGPIFTSQGYGFEKHRDGCDENGTATGLSISSGKLLLHDEAEDATQIDSVYVLSQAATARGVYYTRSWTASSSPCEPYDLSTLPADALPRAAAIVYDDEEVGWLLVGYGARFASADVGSAGLYACPLLSETAYAGTCPNHVLDCYAVDDGDAADEEAMDVRDIEMRGGGLYESYVADGGRRGNGDGSCDQDHSTVYAVRLYNEGAGNPPTMDIWDTDETVTTNRPSWSTDPDNGDAWVAYNAGGGSSGIKSGCVSHDDMSQMVGDLVPPDDAATEQDIVTVTISPDSDFIFGFYSLGDGTANEGCVRHFRADLPMFAAVPQPLAVDDTLQWSPLMDYADRDDRFTTDTDAGTAGYQNGALDRRENVDINDAFLHNEPMPEIYDGFMMDAVFWDNGDSEYPYRLLYASQWSWWIPQTGATVDLNGSAVTAVGWDGDPGTDDLDTMYEGMGTLVARSFQDASVRDVAVLPLAKADGSDAKDVLFTAAADVHLFGAYGDEDPVAREAADRDCHYSGTNVAAGHVDTWSPGTRDDNDNLEYEAWYAPIVIAEIDPHDADGENLLHHHRVEGEWCWDGVQVAGRGNYFKLVDETDWGLQCYDLQYADTTNGWRYACHADEVDEAVAFGMEGLGPISDVVALGHNFALIATMGRCASSTPNDDDICADDSGEGLWLVHDSGTDGLTYTEIPWDQTADKDIGGTEGAVTKQAFFEGVTGSPVKRGNVSLSLHPYTAVSDEGGGAWVFLSSHTKGVRSVKFFFDDDENVSSVQWMMYPITECTYNLPFYPGTPLDPKVTFGVTVSPDAQYFLMFGGSSDGDLSPGGGVCQVDLGSSHTRRVAIPTSGLRQAITSVEPHPDIEGVFAVTTYQDAPCASTGCGLAGVYILQRRNVGTGLANTNWSWYRISGDDLDHPRGTSAAWGKGLGAIATEETEVYDHLYAGMAGGGPWDLDIEW